MLAAHFASSFHTLNFISDFIFYLGLDYRRPAIKYKGKLVKNNSWGIPAPITKLK